ncbi:amidohydrolase family protein [Haladaptatus sp. ZSTT2]|uniref:amidohydrolase family protein n=1 Tax=Haladaptatus sp. ZSTT2 TaxID=3120515 RepID=UPI00300EA862
MGTSDIQILDVHSHFSTEEGFVFQNPGDSDTFGENFEMRTEAEMVEDLKAANVKPMLDFGFTATIPTAEAAGKHDYFAEMYGENPDAFLGLWVQLDPRDDDTAGEFERCLTSLDMGITGFTINGSTTNVPADDDRYDPIYELCLEHNAPVLINVGYSGLGAGQPGGGGHLVEHCHPKTADRVAANYPDLQIVLGRPAWPWQGQAIASLLHKANIVGNELHGWRPKYYPEELTYDISRRLKNKVLFGGDYPLLDYKTLRADWEAMGLDDEVLEKVYYKNAERVFSQFGDV